MKTRNNKSLFSLEFYTRSMPCLTEFYHVFYEKGIKVIPLSIYDLLTPVALAHMIMGDGSKGRVGLELCTDLFELKDIVRLMNVLMIKYRLDCRVRKHGKYSRIYISQHSMVRLRSIVLPYMEKSMLYKIST
jgi:hypothetical protein